MIELQRHIEILLLTNDCVIVPGLGGFMAHHIDARFDEEDNTFIPPLRTLGFNQNLTMNDSLLVQSYIESYDISYPEALRRIEDEVEELRQHLHAEGYYELNDIGVLSLNKEGNLEFSPCEAGILTPGLYGLGTFEMQPLQKSVEEVVEQPVEKIQTVVTPIEDEEQEKAIIIKMSWLRHAVAVAVAIVAFFMIGTPVSNSDIEQQANMQQSSIIPLSPQTPASVADEGQELTTGGLSANEETDGTVAEGQAIDHVAEENAVESMDAPATEEYCIVLASQVSQKNADGFVEQLVKNGFNEAYITNAKFRRVVYGHFATKDEALNQLRQLRKQSKKLFGEGWVMKSED